MQVFKQIADVKTEKMLDLPIPKLKTGQMQVITIPITSVFWTASAISMLTPPPTTG